MDTPGAESRQDGAASVTAPTNTVPPEAASGQHADRSSTKDESHKHNGEWKKRKRDYDSHGGRGGRNHGKRSKKGDLGRGEYFSQQLDKRQRNEQANAKREQEGGGRVPGQGITFPKEEIEAEERRPKRKVAVLIGYSGTGYKGMQISGSERTIEGDIFKAFIKAGAISKANAEDPKKTSLVRCARTDKGVHAAGNMISLKLIIEDENIVEKINAELSPQIRIWGIERTIGGFSCYQACDSRWYEYLMPSYAFLPPHPSSWLAKQMESSADECNDRAAYESRQAEVKGFWEKVDEEEIKPILEDIDEDIRWEVLKALRGEEEASARATQPDADLDGAEKAQVTEAAAHDVDNTVDAATAPTVVLAEESAEPADQHQPAESSKSATNAAKGGSAEASNDPAVIRVQRLRAAAKRLRNAYIAAKRRYRIPKERVDRIQEALDSYVGTNNFYNYTIQKTFKDPSAKRHIKSFVVNRKPILIGDGPDEEKQEWLSLKVHGQSFMMHQIRKMVGMVTLLVRCGSDLKTMGESFTEARMSIPKVPGLGLLLERPVFDSYNNFQAVKHGREKLLFSKYETELEAFKEREIYQRIFREEEERNEFGRFFNQIDNYKESYFLFVTSKGVEATKGSERAAPADSDSEAGGSGVEEG